MIDAYSLTHLFLYIPCDTLNPIQIKTKQQKTQHHNKIAIILELDGFFFILKYHYKSYEQLVRAYPEIDEYRLYYAQSLHKSGQYQAALKACQTIENAEFSQKVRLN